MRVTLSLRREEWDALYAAAVDDRRPLRDEAAYLLVNALLLHQAAHKPEELPV
jgi:hypothetical protein